MVTIFPVLNSMEKAANSSVLYCFEPVNASNHEDAPLRFADICDPNFLLSGVAMIDISSGRVRGEGHRFIRIF